MRHLLSCIGCLLCAFLFAGCGPSTFRLDKDGTSGYFGSDRPPLRTMLCDRGDLKIVLDRAELPEDVRNDFIRHVCSDQRSFESTKSLYLFLAPDEKIRLKKAFEKQGYKINHIDC